MQVVTNVGLSDGNLSVSYAELPTSPPAHVGLPESRKYQDKTTLMRFIDHGHEVKWYLLHGDLSHLNGEHMPYMSTSGNPPTGTDAQKELLHLLRDFTADDVFTRTPLTGLPKCRVNYVVSCYASHELKQRDCEWV